MDPISLNISSEDDFAGNGMELLMNNSASNGSTTRGDNIDDLEKELNDLTQSDINIGVEPLHEHEDKISDIKFDNNVSVGEYTSGMYNPTKSWDGYGQFDEIPSGEGKSASASAPPTPQMSKEEILREKFKYTKLLEKLEKKGVSLSKHYTMESPLMEMQGEYEMLMEDKRKGNSVKLMGNALMMFIKGIEYLNGRFDPFELDLDGLGEQVSENITEYEDVFGELHEKYKTKASLIPELKLLFHLGGSAAMVHMTNTMFKTAAPGVDDLMRQNPDLARQFQAAAVNSMSNTAPGFSNFMNSDAVKPSSVPPTQGIPTQGMPPPLDRNGNNSYGARPDLAHARRQPESHAPRAEMKGPSNLDDILSGLKTQTRTVDVAEEVNNVISADDARSLQSDTNAPKRSRRRPKSEKNTISISI
jgi:hypothetical protein